MKNIDGLIFKAIVGSQSYGTSTPTSDVDYKGVYRQNTDALISFGYKEQIDVTKDEVYYEVRRFLQLLQSANPTVLELLYSPADCVIEKKPVFDLIIQHRDTFLTKKCQHSFGGFAIAQIKKAKGLDKKMNWEKAKVTRKSPIEFVYAYENGMTKPIEKWLQERNLTQERCGLVALDHFINCFALYYDENMEVRHPDTIGTEGVAPLGFRGLAWEDSNDLRLSPVPKGMTPLTIIHFNKDGYSMHCRHYREYTEWLDNRNTQRYVDIEGHNQQIDGKNILHCRRLLDMAMEIATEGTLNVRRPNADYLLKIRRGEVPLEAIIEQAEIDIEHLKTLYAQSSLPNDVDMGFVNELLLEIRHHS